MRTTTSRDVIEIRTVVGEAFVVDPLMRWMFPDDDTRLDATAAWLGLFVEQLLVGAPADVVESDGVDAVAVWRMPDAETDVRSTRPSIAGLLAALVGRERAIVIGNGLAGMRAFVPPAPFAYLQLLAVRPDRQRRGLGRGVIEVGIDRASARGLGMHLESTNPDNLAFYRSMGFDITHETRLEPDGPALWTLWRDPRS